MKKDLNKVVVITGASAGVGRGIAQVLAKRGTRLGLIARGAEKLDSTVKEVEELGGEAIACIADVSDYDALNEAAKKIQNHFGTIDVWINNAMVTILGRVEDLRTDEIHQVMDVNFMGSVNGVKVASEIFFKKNAGHIIQIGSALSYLAIPLQSAYCSSKFAMRGFLQAFRVELKHDHKKIQLSEVHLPAVNTPQFEWMKNYMPKHPMPVPPIFEPQVIGDAVSFIIDHPRSELWIGGPTVKTILGAKFAPWLAEWVLSKKGFRNQQTDIALPKKESNLWQPVNNDYGAKGIFEKEAKNMSLQLEMNKHRGFLTTAGALIAGGLATYLYHRRSLSQSPKL